MISPLFPLILGVFAAPALALAQAEKIIGLTGQVQ